MSMNIDFYVRWESTSWGIIPTFQSWNSNMPQVATVWQKKPVRTASQGIKAKLKENVCIDPCPKESKDINSNVL